MDDESLKKRSSKRGGARPGAGAPKIFTDEKILAAVKKSMGKVFLAAKSLGCHVQTIYDSIATNPQVKAAVGQFRGQHVDDAENALWLAVQKGEAWAVCFTLKTIGKARGYVERQEITGAEGGPVRVSVEGLSDEELDAIDAIYERASSRTAGSQGGEGPPPPTPFSSNGVGDH